MLQYPDTAPNDGLDVVISPYTTTCLASGTSSNGSNGSTNNSRGPSASDPVRSDGGRFATAPTDVIGNGVPQPDNRLSDPVTVQRAAPPVGLNFADSPYVQIPRTSYSELRAETSGTGISPYTVVEQTLLEPPQPSCEVPRDNVQLANSSLDIQPANDAVGNDAAAGGSTTSGDGLTPAERPEVHQLSAAQVVDGYVSWPPPEPSSPLL
jgi:hypothetical protein